MPPKNLPFPPMEAELVEQLPPQSALDGEVVIEQDGKLDFDAMQLRLHPAESRIRKLSAEIPAQYIAFDMLVWNGEPVHERPLEQRRNELEERGALFRLSPITGDRDQAVNWLQRLEAAGLER